MKCSLNRLHRLLHFFSLFSLKTNIKNYEFHIFSINLGRGIRILYYLKYMKVVVDKMYTDFRFIEEL